MISWFINKANSWVLIIYTGATGDCIEKIILNNVFTIQLLATIKLLCKYCLSSCFNSLINVDILKQYLIGIYPTLVVSNKNITSFFVDNILTIHLKNC